MFQSPRNMVSCIIFQFCSTWDFVILVGFTDMMCFFQICQHIFLVLKFVDNYKPLQFYVALEEAPQQNIWVGISNFSTPKWFEEGEGPVYLVRIMQEASSARCWRVQEASSFPILETWRFSPTTCEVLGYRTISCCWAPKNHRRAWQGLAIRA